MRKKLLIAALLGFIAGQLFAPGSAYAQQIVRLYGTLSGAPKALAAAADGSLNVTVH